MSYEIFSDMSADIEAGLANAGGLKYIPMDYMLGDDSFHCEGPESNANMHRFYEQLRSKVPTHTSQIVPANYIDAFEPYVKEGREILYLSLSSGLSNTYESALMAVENLKEMYDEVKIEVVDSLGATGGMGLLVESAFANRDAGMDLQENAKWLRDHAKNVHYWFKVEDLMYLKRGGRVSAATAVVGTALNIKPILTINPEGKLDTIDKKRGNRQAMKAMLQHFESTFDNSISNVVYICAADCMEDAEALKKLVLEKNPELNVKITMLSPIIGSHTGPDMLSLIHYGTDRSKV